MSLSLGLGLALTRNKGVGGHYLPPLLDGYGNLYAVHAAGRVLSSYTGPLYRIRRDSDAAELDVSAPNGWPSVPALTSWLGGATGFVTTVYDQTGNGRHLTQPTAAKQPRLNLSGGEPVFDLSGNVSELLGTTGLADFSKNQSGLSIATVRRNDVTTAADRLLTFVSSGTGAAATRMALGPVASLVKQALGGRRLDADSIARTAGFDMDTEWAVEIGRWDYAAAKAYHNIDAQTETKTPFLTAGSTSNTSSLAVAVGGTGAGAAFFNGKISLIAWVQALLTDQQTLDLTASLAAMEEPYTPSIEVDGLSWEGQALTGNYTLAPGLTNYTVSQPNGSTPTEADLLTHKYRHHSRCITFGGSIWVANSSGGTNEDAGGQVSTVTSSADDGATWGAPVLALGAQSTFSGTGASYVTGSRITYPRAFVEHGGNLYIVNAIDDVTAGNDLTGTALVATQCNSDGTVGTPFRVTSETYTPQSGFPAIDYDATLGPPIFALANLYGTWGGSSPAKPQSSWVGFASYNGHTFAEPATLALSGSNMLRIWRKISGTTTRFWQQFSRDAGASWGAITASDIPNSPSSPAILELPDGRIAVAGNPMDNVGSRDQLFLAIFDQTTGILSSLYAVRQGVSGTPTYAGTAKFGGASYPCLSTDGTNLWVSYSITKEKIGATKIPLAGI